MTLDGKHQHQHMTRTLRTKLDRLQASYASPHQALPMVKTAVMTSLAYALPMVPCTAADVEKWDSMINTFVKRKFGLWTSAPSALIRQDKQAFGLWGRRPASGAGGEAALDQLPDRSCRLQRR